MTKSILILLLLLVSVAHADISIQGLPPAAGLSFTYMETANTNMIRGKEVNPGAMFLNTQYGYINHPLTWSDGDKGKDIVSGLQTLDLRAGILLRENLNFSLNMSMNSLSFPQEGTKYALGDSVAQMKYRLTDIHNDVQVALIPEVYLPVGSEKYYISTGQLGGALRLAVARSYERFKFATNIGYRALPGAKLQNLDYSKQIIAGLSTEFIATDYLSFNLEGIGFISTPYNEEDSTGEIYFGALYAMSPLTVLTGGVSRSGINNKDNQSFRGILGFKTYFDQGKETPNAIVPAPVREISSVKRCYTEPYSNTYHSRPLTIEETRKLKGLYPYLADVRAYYQGDTVMMTNLRYGEMTGVIGDDFPFVKDSQTAFAIDMTDVPDLKTIKAINHAWLKMRVNKLSQDDYLGTEILCSLNFKLCSGETLQQEKWGGLRNPRFFDGKERIVNNRFSKLYLDKPIREVKGEFLYSKMLTFPLNDIVEGSQVEVKHFFQNPKNGKKTLYFVVGDDTFLSNEVSLEVSMGVERCFQRR